jgi:hypothetical protein
MFFLDLDLLLAAPHEGEVHIVLHGLLLLLLIMYRQSTTYSAI